MYCIYYICLYSLGLFTPPTNTSIKFLGQSLNKNLFFYAFPDIIRFNVNKKNYGKSDQGWSWLHLLFLTLAAAAASAKVSLLSFLLLFKPFLSLNI